MECCGSGRDEINCCSVVGRDSVVLDIFHGHGVVGVVRLLFRYRHILAGNTGE